MTGTSEPFGAMPTDEARPNWSWLQEKMNTNAVAELDQWMDSQLLDLEEEFAQFVTPKSLGRSLAGSR